MSYSKHTIVLTDIQTLVVCDALNMLIQAEDKHPDDKRIAQNIRLMINDAVRLDKGIKEQK